MINIISDTVTTPTPAMLDAMMSAKVGDDVFKGDPSINALQEKAAEMFGMEAGLFCPSGTMTNQIAINVHTDRLDEMICHKYSHVYQYETGGYAFNSGVAVNLLEGDHGKITAEQVAAAIKPVYDWLPISKLVVLENTNNKGGGSYYTLDEIKPITDLCKERGLRLHLDGARLFNALTETGETTLEVGKHFDTISICLSKGLGAPVGSLLLGPADFIAKARRVRKVMGGGMRQAGFLAAAGLYALENHVDRLKEDHEHARIIETKLKSLPYIENVRPVQTNLIIFDVKPPLTSDVYIQKLNEHGIMAAAYGPQTMRFVTHLDFSREMLEVVLGKLDGMVFNT